MTQMPGEASSTNSGESRTVGVTVIAETDASTGEVRFKLDSDLIEGEDDGGLIFDQDRDDMRKLDYYLVEFELEDRTDLGLRFASDVKEAFWVVTGPGDEPNPPCPTSASYSEEIHALEVCDEKLVIRNENNTIANFTYSLGFVTSDGQALRLDPGGSNKDGGTV